MKITRLDRLIAALSPAAGIRRATARAALARLTQPQPASLTQHQQDRINATAKPSRTPHRWFARPER